MVDLDLAFAIQSNQSGRTAFGNAYAQAQSQPGVTIEQTAAMQAWASAAPTLPAGALLGLAKSGVDPKGPTGQWLIKTAVPALGSNDTNVAGNAAVWFNPDNQPFLDRIAHLPISQQTQLLNTYTAPNLAGLPNDQLNRVLNGESPTEHHGFLNHVGDYLTTGVRYVGAGLQAGAETTSGLVKRSVADLNAWGHGDFSGIGKAPNYYQGGSDQQYTVNLPRLDFHLPHFLTGLGEINLMHENSQALHDITTDPLGGAAAPSIETTPLTTRANVPLISQSALGRNVAYGESLGNGFFPGGEAASNAVLAQKAAASVAGHALTPGRALASFVAEPGTLPYQLGSGFIDYQVAMKGDPSIVLLNEVSAANKARKVFSASSDEAVARAAAAIVDQVGDKTADLRKIVGGTEAGTSFFGHVGYLNPLDVDLVAKIKADPGVLTTLEDAGLIDAKPILRAMGSPNVGAFQGLRKWLDPQTTLTHVNSEDGQAVIDSLAKETSLTALRQKFGKDVPVELLDAFAKESNPDVIRGMYGAAIGTDVRKNPSVGFDWMHGPTNARWAHFLPNGSVSLLDKNNAVEQAERAMIEVKVPLAERDKVMSSIASAQNKGEFFDGFVHQQGRAIADQLVDKYGMNKKDTREMTTFFQSRLADDGKIAIDEVGNMPHLTGFMLDGAGGVTDEPMLLHSVTLESEMADEIPVLNGRDLKRAASMWGKVDQLNNSENMLARGAAKGVTLADYLASTTTNLWKSGKLLRLGLPIRVVAEAQARMAVDGLASGFRHPMDAIAIMTGHKLSTDALGAAFDYEAQGGRASDYARSTGRSSWLNGRSVFDPESQMAKHLDTFARGDIGHEGAWANQLATSHADNLSREVARAMLEPLTYTPGGYTGDKVGIDAVKEAYAADTGSLAQSRQNMIDAKLWGKRGVAVAPSENLAERAVSDRYVDYVVDRNMQMTASNPDLLDHIAHGTVFGPSGANRDLFAELKEYAANGVGPELVRGPAELAKGGRDAQILSNALDRFFSSLVEQPYSKLAKHPVYVQKYWGEVERLRPYLTQEAQDAIGKVAEANGVDWRPDVLATGALDAPTAHKLANVRALQGTQDILHFVSERNNMADTLRYVAPFADAWRNVIGQWAKLAYANPSVFRRIQQGVTEARSSGFFYADPANGGKETFTVVPGAVTKFATGVDWRMGAPVQGLNLASQGLPGMGPVGQLAATEFMPKTGVLGEVRNLMLPYGSPDYAGGIMETFAPGWLDKLRTAGWLGGDFMSSNHKRLLDTLTNDVVKYNMSITPVDTTNPEAMDMLWQKSKAQAQRLYVLRAMAQAVSPAAPDFQRTAQVKGGQLAELYLLTQDYSRMLTLAGGDDYKATSTFVNKYGANMIFATQPSSRTLVYGLPTTQEAEIFRAEHPTIADTAPGVYGYFAPQTGAFDYQAYLSQIQRGEREPLSGLKWMKLAEARLGNAVYNQLRAQLPASLNQDQRNWLSINHDKIAQQYPGFGEQGLQAEHYNLDDKVGQLKLILTNPDIKGTPLAHAAAIYVHLRDQALAEAQKRTGSASSTLTGNQMADLRGWLYQDGQKIASDMPEFTHMWDTMFRDEVAP